MERSSDDSRTFLPVRVTHHRAYHQARAGVGPSDNGVTSAIDATAFVAPLPAPAIQDLLDGRRKDDDLDVTVTYSRAVVSPGDRLQLCVDADDNLVGTPFDVTDSNATTAVLKLPAAARPEKEHHVYCKTSYLSTGSGVDFGPRTRFYVDTQAPGHESHLAAPEFTPEVMANGILPGSLTQDPGGNYLKATIGSYSDIDLATDTVTAYIDDKSDTAVIGTVVGDSIEIHIDETFIADQGDGDHSFSYTVTDRAYNDSTRSKAQTLTLLLNAAFDPVAPKVPAYDDDATDKLIDEADARAEGGLQVVIPADTKLKKDDTITLLWGGARSVPVDVADPAADISIGVSYGTVLDSWNTTANGADLNVDVNVAYEVSRNGKRIGTSPNHQVTINLYQAAGVDPYPETPWNENLVAPSLKSASGADNTIPLEDFGEAAGVTVPWFDQGGTTTYFQAGDVLIVEYANVDLAPRTIDTDDVTAAADLAIELPATNITDAGSGDKPLAYRIRRTLSGGAVNDSLSPPQVITVTGTDELPGGNTGLPALEIPEAVGNDGSDADRLIITRKSAGNGVHVKIPPYENQAVTDVVTVDFAYKMLFIDEVTDHTADVVAAPPETDRPWSFVKRRDQISDNAELVIDLTKEEVVGKLEGFRPRMHAHITYTVQNEHGTAERTTAFVTDIDPRGTD